MIAPEVVNALLAAGANPNLANNSGETPLMAAASNSTEILQELLDHGAEIRMVKQHYHKRMMMIMRYLIFLLRTELM